VTSVCTLRYEVSEYTPNDSTRGKWHPLLGPEIPVCVWHSGSVFAEIK
jgi:hypothetical protein